MERRTKNADCIIVGGGCIGLAIAYRLACDGREVLLLDRAACGCEASWAGAGILSPCNPHRDDALAILQDRSLAMFAAYCERLREESDVDPQYRRCGELTLLVTEQAMQIAESDVAAAAKRLRGETSPEFRFRTVDEVYHMEPVTSGSPCLGALECENTAQVRNPRFLRALRIACERKGVGFREGHPVQDYIREGTRVLGVRTDEGNLTADWTIITAGAWSSGFGRALAALIPIHPVRGQMVLLRAPSQPFERILSSGKNYLVARMDGYVLAGTTEEPGSGFSKRVTAQGIRSILDTALWMAPGLAELPVEVAWAGLRPGTPDNRPYLGLLPGFDGAIAATGHFRAGLTLAPVTAEVIAALVCGEPYDLDLSLCAPGRFDHRS